MNVIGFPAGFFLTSNMHKIHFRLGSAPDRAEGAYVAPQTPIRMVRGHPSGLPTFNPCLDLGAYGIRIVIGPRDNGFPGPAVALDRPDTVAPRTGVWTPGLSLPVTEISRCSKQCN